VYQISKQSDNRFTLYGNFDTLTKIRKKKKEKLSQFLKLYILETPGVIYMKFGMWGTDGGGHLHSKNHPVSYKLRIRENCIIVLPVNILMVWHTSFLG